MHSLANIALFSADQQLQDLLEEKSRCLQIPVLHDEMQPDYLLTYDSIETPPGYSCQLQASEKKAPGPVKVDFIRGKAAHRRLYGGGRKQPLARAIGIKPGFTPDVLDTTAGLGRDSFVLACLDCEVTLLERNPVIHELLLNGLLRAAADPGIGAIVKHMQLINNDAISYLHNLQKLPDTIYLDPMYPERNKSALVKKEMRYFHDIAGKDNDAVQLLEKAIECRARRVVVKRPGSAGPLGELKASASVASKNTRYDIYLS